MALPKRTIDEVVQRLRRLRTGFDVFVEGKDDRRFLKKTLSVLQHREVTITAIDEIEVPAVVLAEFGLGTGNRSRVIALARKLQQAGLSSTRLLCAIDPDEDLVLARAHDCELLMCWDVTAVECFAFDESILSEWARHYLDDGVLARSLPGMQEALQAAFSIRLAVTSLSVPIAGYPDFEKSAARQTDRIEFCIQRYDQLFFQRNPKLKTNKPFAIEVHRFRINVAGPASRRIRGHDLIQALRQLAIAFGVKPFLTDEDAVRETLLALVGYRHVALDPGITRLVLGVAEAIAVAG